MPQYLMPAEEKKKKQGSSQTKTQEFLESDWIKNYEKSLNNHEKSPFKQTEKKEKTKTFFNSYMLPQKPAIIPPSLGENLCFSY